MVSGGISAEPSAETSAIFDPQMSEKKYATTITDMPSPPLHPADQRARQLDQRVAHAAALHQVAGEHEGGDREQHPALRARHQRRGELLHRIAAEPQPGDAGDAEREHDRHREQDQADENDGDGRQASWTVIPVQCMRLVLPAAGDSIVANAVDGDQDAADDRGRVEPGQIDLSPAW